MVNGEHEVYFHHNYKEQFLKDMEEASGLVLIQSPFIGMDQMAELIVHIREVTRRGIRCCAFLQKQKPNADKWRIAATDYGIKLLLEAGVHVTIRKEIHEKLAIFDERVAWEGTMNMLSHKDTTERINRWTDRPKLEEIIASHKLDGCIACLRTAGFRSSAPDAVQELRKQLGALVAQRRKYLGLSQTELAGMVGVHQSVISMIESSSANLKINRLLEVCLAMRLGLRPMPWFVLPSVDDAVAGLTNGRILTVGNPIWLPPKSE